MVALAKRPHYRWMVYDTAGGDQLADCDGWMGGVTQCLPFNPTLEFLDRRVALLACSRRRAQRWIRPSTPIPAPLFRGGAQDSCNSATSHACPCQPGAPPLPPTSLQVPSLLRPIQPQHAPVVPRQQRLLLLRPRPTGG